MKVIPIEGEFGETMIREFISPYYVNVLVKRFDTIHVSIKTQAGERVRFAFGTVFVKLHFKRRGI